MLIKAFFVVCVAQLINVLNSWKIDGYNSEKQSAQTPLKNLFSS